MTPGSQAARSLSGRRRATAAIDHALRLARLPGLLLVVADFDGTLAEFDPDPMAAVILPAARRALRRLARIGAHRPDRLALAVLTGRTSLDVATRVRVGGVRYLGNMGNETGILPRGARAERLAVNPAPGMDGRVTPAERLAESVVAALTDARRGAPPSWLFVEAKGPAVAFHYRAAADRDEARRQLETAFSSAGRAGLLVPFTRIDGRFLVDLQPRGAGAKGEAVERLIDELRPTAAIVLGDDRADAEAFRALDRARTEGRVRDGLAVAVRHPHPLPSDVEAAADTIVDGIPAAVTILAAVARELEREA